MHRLGQKVVSAGSVLHAATSHAFGALQDPMHVSTTLTAAACALQEDGVADAHTDVKSVRTNLREAVQGLAAEVRQGPMRSAPGPLLGVRASLLSRVT
jgi:hypothetical protein